MFIKVKHEQGGNFLLNVNEISHVAEGNGTKSIIFTRSHGPEARFMSPLSLDHLQDVLIDNAAQVTAPIATRIMSMENCVTRLARSMEDWLEQANTPIMSPEPLVVDLGSSQLEEELKQAARYRWLKKHARQEGRDGGWCQVVTFGNVDISDGRTFNHRTLDAAIDAAIKSEKRTCDKE